MAFNSFPECSGYNGAKCTESFVNKYLKSLNVTDFKYRTSKVYPIKSLSGAKQQPFVGESKYKWFYMADGSCFLIVLNYDAYHFCYIFYDINGNKKPNVVGKDIFVFDFGKHHNYKPEFESGFTNTKAMKKDNAVTYLTQKTRTACSKTAGSDNYNSFSCGALIHYQNWQITKDYPW